MRAKSLSSREVYQNYYQYSPSDGVNRAEEVGKLLLPFMQNSQEALSKVILLMNDPGYKAVKAYLAGKDRRFQEVTVIDDIMQNTGMEIMRMAFRGVPEWVTEEGFYGYLLNTYKTQAKHEVTARSKKERLDDSYEERTETGFDILSGEEGFDSTWENAFQEEKNRIEEIAVAAFVNGLAESDVDPHKIVTYCYASLLPVLYKDSKNEKFLNTINEISGRKYNIKTSGYSPDKGIFGEIARSSDVLMKWAVDAMYDMEVDFLQQEAENLYNMAPLAGQKLKWGREFNWNLDKQYKNKAIRNIVITSEFGTNTINNWPSRFVAVLYRQIVENCMKNREFVEYAKEYVMF